MAYANARLVGNFW